MRQCPLRAGLSRAVGTGALVLGNPKAWLGNAYHLVLARVAESHPSREQVHGIVTALWNEAISGEHERAESHPLDRRFGRPETWPGYHLALAAVRLRAKEQIEHPDRPARPGSRPASPVILKEHVFTAYGGKLVGRPDLVRGTEIVDYKSGSIADEYCEGVKHAYVRQLRIYGHLVRETLGVTPERGTLLPLIGPAVSVDLDPTECEREAAEAVSLLDTFNSSLRGSTGMASPSPQSCRWCAYKLICVSFWQAVSPLWSGRLDGEAIEGVVSAAPRSLYEGAAAVSIESSDGTQPAGGYEVSPLNVSAHAVVPDLRPGDHARVVGLRAHGGRELRPGPRTILARVTDLPGLEFAAAESQ